MNLEYSHTNYNFNQPRLIQAVCEWSVSKGILAIARWVTSLSTNRLPVQYNAIGLNTHLNITVVYKSTCFLN